MFVDPISRQTFPFDNEIHRVGGYKNAFQLDLDDLKSWYQLMPAPIPFKTPLVFAPKIKATLPSFPYTIHDAQACIPQNN